MNKYMGLLPGYVIRLAPEISPTACFIFPNNMTRIG